MKPIIVQIKMDDEYKKEMGMLEGYNEWFDRDREENDLYSSDKELLIGLSRVYFSYYTGSYEGGGDMVFLYEGRWYHRDCGHCSCYGPCEEGYGEDNSIIGNLYTPYHDINNALDVSNFSKKMKEDILRDWT